MDTAAPLPQGCPELAGLPYWGELHKFLLSAPALVAAGTAAASRYLASAVWSGSQVAGAAGYKIAAAVLAPIGTLLAWFGVLCASHTFQILGAVLLFVAWQIYFPSRVLIRLLAKLPYCRGVSFEFAPAPDAPAPDSKYIALTIDDGPCPYNTAAVLDELKTAGAKATFFVIGSHVEKCDVMGVGSGRNGGEGHYPLGQETLRRMFTEGHELGNHTWHDRPSHSLSPKQLTNEICQVHKLISSARQAALTAQHSTAGHTDYPDSEDLSPSAAAAVAGPRTKWFRPGWGWFTPEMVDTAQKLGYHTVLGSVWPWDVYSKWPLLNALYICAKAYPGAVVVLHDRRRHLLPTLQYVLPWLNHLGYDVVTLSEAAYRSNGRGPELTPAALEAHNRSHSSLSMVSAGSARSLDASTAAALPHLAPSAAYLARMQKETERAAMHAAMEEAERQHLKNLKRQDADRRAGIDRRLVDMSAAEKRTIERREREKKEAEIRRARRKIEEAKARERYDRYVKERAERHEREAKERAEAKQKAREAEERRKIAEEEYTKRKEAERKYAAEMVARQKVEREAREAEAAAAAAAVAAAAAAGPEVTTASEAEESTVGGSSVGFSGDQPGEKTKKKKGMSLLRKAAQRLGVKPSDKSSSSSKGAAAAAAAAAATAAGAAAAAGFAGAAAFSSSAAPTDYAASTASAGDSSIIYSTADSSALAEPQVPIEASDVAPSMYGWYGLSPSSSSLAALASIDTAVAAYAAAAAAGTDLPPPVTGTYARDPYGRILLGFDGLPLLLSITEGLDSEGQGSTEGSAEGTEVQPVLLNSQGEPLIGPHGEKIVMLLGAHNMPLADPHGRPVFVAETEAGQLRGVHPDGSIIMVPAAAEGSHGSNSHKHDSAAAAAASDRGSSSSTFGDVGTGGMGPMQQGHYAYGSDSGGSGSIKEASSYAPSLSRTSVRSNLSSTAAAAAAAAGLPPRAPTGTPVAASPTAAAAAAAMAAAEPAAVAAMAHTAAYREGFAEGFVPATLVLGPSGRPLLGLDNRLLIVAVDEEGVPLVEGPEGQPLLGPDSKPLTLAYSSDGSLVALDSMCRPLVGPDGCSHMVALDKNSRPMADSTNHAIILTLGPAGYIVTEAAADTDSTPAAGADTTDYQAASWSGTDPTAPRMSHSGNSAALLAAAAAAAGGGGRGVGSSGFEGMLGGQGESACLPVVDAADYGACSFDAAAGVGVAGAAAAAADVAADNGREDEGTEAEARGEIALPAAATAGSFTGKEDEHDRDNVMLRDQQQQPAAAPADAAAVPHTSHTPGLVAQAAAGPTEPTGMDLFGEPQPGQQQDAAAAAAASLMPANTAEEGQTVQGTTAPTAAAAAAGAAAVSTSTPTAAKAPTAAAPAGPDSEDSGFDSQASTPRSTPRAAKPLSSHPGSSSSSSHPDMAPQLVNAGLAGERPGSAVHLGGEGEDLPVGKIRLSAQGVAVTATASSH